MSMAKSPADICFTSSGKENCDERTLLFKVFKSIFDLSFPLNNNAVVAEKINSIQDQVIKQGLLDPESQNLLTNYYKTAEVENSKEERAIRKSLETIYEIRNIRHQKIRSLLQSQRSSTFLKLLQVTATRLPVWYPRGNERVPQLCGAVGALPSYIAKSGDLVAALVKQSGEERWIVAEAVAFKHGKYEVEDIDVKEANRNFTLDKKFVKPLPLMRADPLICPEAFFPHNSFVLAMYPQTTCFFKALVNAPPKNSLDGYEVLFEDDYSKYTILMVVAQRFVVSAPTSLIAYKDDSNAI